MTNLLVIEDTTIRSMLDDPRIVKLLPCLSGAAANIKSVEPGGKDCAACKAKRSRIMQDSLKTARACIGNARGTILKSLLQILDTRQIRIMVTNGAKKELRTLF